MENIQCIQEYNKQSKVVICSIAILATLHIAFFAYVLNDSETISYKTVTVSCPNSCDKFTVQPTDLGNGYMCSCME